MLADNYLRNLLYLPFQQILPLITVIHSGEHGKLSNKFRHAQYRHNIHLQNANLTTYQEVEYYARIKLFNNLSPTIKFKSRCKSI